MVYKVQLITNKQKHRLMEKYLPKLLYRRKASLRGCCIELMTNNEWIKETWENNFYLMSEDVAPHGILVAIYEPKKPMSVRYNPSSRTAFLVNVDYYGWVKSIALGITQDIFEDIQYLLSCHSAALDINGKGVSVAGMSGAGKTTCVYGLAREPGVKLISDDWYYVRIADGEAIAFGSEKNNYIEAGVSKLFGEYKQLVEKSKFDNRKRAIADVRWVVGRYGVIPQTTMKKLILLNPKQTSVKAANEKQVKLIPITAKKAFEYLRKKDWLNPHQLVRSPAKLSLRKELYKKYLKELDCYILERPCTDPQRLPQARYNKIVQRMIKELKKACGLKKVKPKKLPFEKIKGKARIYQKQF